MMATSCSREKEPEEKALMALRTVDPPDCRRANAISEEEAQKQRRFSNHEEPMSYLEFGGIGYLSFHSAEVGGPIGPAGRIDRFLQLRRYGKTLLSRRYEAECA
jgi:hypothetical protein